MIIQQKIGAFSLLCGEARPAPGIARWIYRGVRLATSSGTAVEIVRKKGVNVIISPSNRETFLEWLNDVLKAAQNSAVGSLKFYKALVGWLPV